MLEGESASSAYELAGYVKDDGNATRLRQNESVRARLLELQNEIAKETQVTVESLLNELEAARQKATDLDQLSAAVRAIEAKAKVSGLLVQKMEVGGAGDFSKCETVEEVVDDLLKYSLNPSYQIATERDRQELIDTKRHHAEMREMIDAIKARPVPGIRVDSPAKLAISNGIQRQRSR